MIIRDDFVTKPRLTWHPTHMSSVAWIFSKTIFFQLIISMHFLDVRPCSGYFFWRIQWSRNHGYFITLIWFYGNQSTEMLPNLLRVAQLENYCAQFLFSLVWLRVRLITTIQYLFLCQEKNVMGRTAPTLRVSPGGHTSDVCCSGERICFNISEFAISL